jgi:hypothetical protein
VAFRLAFAASDFLFTALLIETVWARIRHSVGVPDRAVRPQADRRIGWQVLFRLETVDGVCGPVDAGELCAQLARMLVRLMRRCYERSISRNR